MSSAAPPDGAGSSVTNLGGSEDRIGTLGTGTLNVINSATYTSNANMQLGRNAGPTGSTGSTGSTGTVNVGTGDMLTVRNMVAGNGNNGLATGTLNIGAFGGGTAEGMLNATTILGGRGTPTLNFNQTNDVTLSAIISGTMMVNQLGTGKTTLTAENTYTGATTVGAEILRNDGSIADPTTVASGGTLMGTGQFAAVTIQSGGILSPGGARKHWT